MTTRRPALIAAAPAPAPRAPGIFSRSISVSVPTETAPATGSAVRTFDAILATASPVRRTGLEGEFFEVLSMEGALLRRINEGAPVLDSHDSSTVARIVGHVQPGSVRVEAGTLRGRIAIAAESIAPGVLARIEAGHLRALSIGYSVLEWADGGLAEDGATPVAIAALWEPLEISLVAVPADPAASILPTPEPAAAAEDEGTRSMNWITAPLDRRARFERDLEAAHNAVLRHGPRISVTRDGGDFERRGIEDAIYAKLSGAAPTDYAKPFHRLGLTDLARRSLELTGASTRFMGRADIWQRSGHVTSDFPNLLAAAGNRHLLERYTALETPLKRLCRRRDVPDFRTIRPIRLDGQFALDRVPEGGELRYGTYRETAETYAPAIYAAGFSLSLQALMNDDLGAFDEAASDAARMAAKREADILSGLVLGDGPVLSDGQPLFSTAAGRGNKAATGGALIEANLSAARAALRTVKDAGGAPMGLPARFIVVGAALETAAEKIVADVTPDSTAGANPFTGMEVLTEPRLTGNSWRVFADPVATPILQMSYIEGMAGPQLEFAQEFDRFGIVFRVSLHFGAGVIGWRGAYLNPGA